MDRNQSSGGEPGGSGSSDKKDKQPPTGQPQVALPTSSQVLNTSTASVQRSAPVVGGYMSPDSTAVRVSAPVLPTSSPSSEGKLISGYNAPFGQPTPTSLQVRANIAVSPQSSQVTTTTGSPALTKPSVQISSNPPAGSSSSYTHYAVSSTRHLAKPQESVELPLTHPEYYEEMGIKPPKGVILHGLPGTDVRAKDDSSGGCAEFKRDDTKESDGGKDVETSIATNDPLRSTNILQTILAAYPAEKVAEWRREAKQGIPALAKRPAQDMRNDRDDKIKELEGLTKALKVKMNHLQEELDATKSLLSQEKMKNKTLSEEITKLNSIISSQAKEISTGEIELRKLHNTMQNLKAICTDGPA